MLAGTAAVARFLAATILLYAGCQKLAVPRDFRATLTHLLIPTPRIVAVAIPITEIAVAVMLLVIPASVVTPASVSMLGGMFAIVGFSTRIRGLWIDCACFGSGRRRRLGLRQVIYLPFWLGVAGLTIANHETIRGYLGLRVLATDILGLCIVAGFVAIPSVRENRRYTQFAR